jgi:hypothetical protein
MTRFPQREPTSLMPMSGRVADLKAQALNNTRTVAVATCIWCYSAPS